MKKIKFIAQAGLLICLFSGFVPDLKNGSRGSLDNDSIPKWVIEHWEFLTGEGGTWIADNSTYKNTSEPYEAYGMKWEWGFAQRSIKGSLYGIKDDEQAGVFWEFHSVWHPGEKKVKEYQFGSDGTLGIGELRRTGEQSLEQYMQFFAPDGSVSSTGHRVEIKNGEQHSQSYIIRDSGEWEERRFYIWKPIAS